MTYCSETEVSFSLSPALDLKSGPLEEEGPGTLSRPSAAKQLQKELEDLKASTVREKQRAKNFKRKIELADQKSERLQMEHDRLVMKIAGLTTEIRILKSQEADNQWLLSTNNNLRAIVEKLSKLNPQT